MQQNVLLENPGRPSRPLGKIFRWQYVKWNIPTLSSAPKTHPNALNEDIISAILRSLSSIKRVIKRNELWRKKRRYRWNEKRPLPTAPGELIQTDTVHYVNPLNHAIIAVLGY